MKDSIDLRDWTSAYVRSLYFPSSVNSAAAKYCHLLSTYEISTTNDMPPLPISQSQLPATELAIYTCHGLRLRKVEAMMSGSHARKLHWTQFMLFTSISLRTNYSSFIPLLHTVTKMVPFSH
jgi:hypothetical protein